MKSIRVYDLDYQNIADICEDNNVNEYEVIEALLTIVEDEAIDISAWL